MPNIFDTVAVNKIKKSLFNLSHMRKFSCNLGYLVPIECTEVMPNDTFKIKHEALVKFSPLLAPMMQECDMFIERFYVPNRLVWSHWNDFITPSDNGTYPAMPYFNYGVSAASQFAVGTLFDYMGLPVGDDLPESNMKVQALPFVAYNLIWNEYYRDQNLQTEAVVPKEVDGLLNSSSMGVTTPVAFQLRKRCWPKDYFTSALPTTQRGGDVRMPLTGDANILMRSTSNPSLTDGVSATANGSSSPRAVNLTTGLPNGTAGSLVADMSSVTAATINELRKATALQEYLELNMRVGGRINEFIYGNFGARVEDYRIDRPQFLGGMRQPIVVSELNQTSATVSNQTPLATQAGLAFGTGSSRSSSFYVREHGWIITLFSVLPKASYQQGLPRKFSRFDPLDYANPKFANLGEQAILNKEIYLKSTDPNGVFGYTPRYAEYKYEPSTVHGEFKTTLNYWHMGRIFDSEPALNASFVEANPSTRPFAVVEGNDKLRVEVYNRIKALRPLPYYGTPKLL